MITARLSVLRTPLGLVAIATGVASGPVFSLSAGSKFSEVVVRALSQWLAVYFDELIFHVLEVLALPG